MGHAPGWGLRACILHCVPTKNYTHLAAVYDGLMGAGYSRIYKRLISKYVRKEQPRSEQKAILELGCGTGIVLRTLSAQYDTVGIDLSPAMIRIARKNDARSRYHIADMRSFALPKKFDVIIAAFDTINHLLNFQDWRKAFARVAAHLKEGGVFIFDINTLEKFMTIHRRTVRRRVGSYFVVMETAAKGNACTWDIAITRGRPRQRPPLPKERITEASFPVTRVRSALLDYFPSVTVLRHLGPGRVFFVARKSGRTQG